jgi:hypothetical protein
MIVQRNGLAGVASDEACGEADLLRGKINGAKATPVIPRGQAPGGRS